MNYRAAIAQTARDIIDRAEAEGRDPTPFELAKVEALWARFESLEDPGASALPFDADADWTARG